MPLPDDLEYLERDVDRRIRAALRRLADHRQIERDLRSVTEEWQDELARLDSTASHLVATAAHLSEGFNAAKDTSAPPQSKPSTPAPRSLWERLDDLETERGEGVASKAIPEPPAARKRGWLVYAALLVSVLTALAAGLAWLN